MAKKMLIDATHAEETRVVVVDGTKVEEFDFETVNKRQLAGNIYLAKVTRVEPSLQAAFVDYGGNRHGFLAFSEIHPDYYQIPVADRQALLEEERADARAEEEERAATGNGGRRKSPRRSRKADEAADAAPQAQKGALSVEPGDDTPGDTGPATQSAAPDAGAEALTETGVVPVPDQEAGADSGTAADAASETGGETVDANQADAANAEPVGKSRSSRGRSRSRGGSRTQAARDDEQVLRSRSIPGMDILDLDSEETGAAGDRAPAAEDAATNAPDDSKTSGKGSADETPYAAVDHASDIDSEIESIADEDVTEEIRPKRKPRPRRYKIQEVVKVRQIMLVQVVKEERGNKGAALTTYLSLPGRYCVLMPNTARGGGISRKITNAADRKKLKEIAGEMTVPEGAGLIIRTAGAERTRTEIKRDYEYLMRLWEQIRELTLKSIAPAPIYEEGNLIKRAIRDLYSRDIDEVLVEGVEGYRTAKDFMKMIMPSHARNVKQHTEGLPLFARYQVESYLAAMFNPVVQLKSGGYIVIGITEALVAIDVNSGRSTKEGSIEDTALKTNLEAAEEVARQLRLRDLAGLIVIDFIDMEERKNNNAVEKRLKERLKTDRARIQVGRISGFGLMEMSRQRLRPGMIEVTTQPCPACHGTGLIRSDDSLGLAILRQLEEEGTRRRSREVLLRAPVQVVNFLMNQKREHIAVIEARYGMAVRIEADPALVSPDFAIEKFKTATRSVPDVAVSVVSMDTPAVESDDAEEEVDTVAATGDTTEGADDRAGGDGQQPRKKRRRRRRRRGGGQSGGDYDDRDTAEDGAAAAAAAAGDGNGDAPTDGTEAAEQEATKPRRRRVRSSTRRASGDNGQNADSEPGITPDDGTEKVEVPEPKAAAKAPARKRGRRKADTQEVADTAGDKAATAETPDAATGTVAEEGPEPAAAKPARKRAPRKTAARKAAETVTDAASADDADSAPAAAAVEPAEPAPVFESARDAPVVADDHGTAEAAPQKTPDDTPGETEAPAAADTADKTAAPRRRGWWSLRR